MCDDEPYNVAVRAFFEHPNHAGVLDGKYTREYVGSVQESEYGARLEMSLAVLNGVIVAMRFRAMACPHLIAAAETACATYENGPVSALQTFDARELMERLSVPIEKTGRMLLLEDAIALLVQQHMDRIK